MTRTTHRRWTARLAAALTLLLVASCASPPDDEPTEDPEAAERRRAVLTHLGEDVVLATYGEFSQRAEALEAAADTYADSLDDGDADDARQAWRDATDVWQRAELFQIGPAGPMDTVAAGEDMRDQIYSWPIVNPCRVDQELVAQSYQDQDALRSQPVNVRGLDAIEYLLFETGTDNACAPNSSINTDGSWAELDEAEIRTRRANYAHALAVDLAQSAAELEDAWAADAGNFIEQFSRAGDTSDTYATTQEALNAVSDAMFYLDKEVKDMKLAWPTGLSDCAEDTCPDKRESRFADASLAHTRANLVGFRQLFHGADPDDDDQPGVDDLLRAKGADELADDMSARIEDAIDAVDAVDATMVDALETDPQPIVDVYMATKAITDLFKSQFFDVLDLDVPERGEGDND
jgi:uncharacterized protein